MPLSTPKQNVPTQIYFPVLSNIMSEPTMWQTQYRYIITVMNIRNVLIFPFTFAEETRRKAGPSRLIFTCKDMPSQESYLPLATISTSGKNFVEDNGSSGISCYLKGKVRLWNSHKVQQVMASTLFHLPHPPRPPHLPQHHTEIMLLSRTSNNPIKDYALVSRPVLLFLFFFFLLFPRWSSLSYLRNVAMTQNNAKSF